MTDIRHRLAAKRGSSKFTGELLLLYIDDEPLDAFLVRHTQEPYLEGLIPTLLGCDSERETALVVGRIIPSPGCITRPPVLMCPDDVDLSCTTIIVEAVGYPEYVVWRRIGLDRTPEHQDTERVGETVEWFEGVEPLSFAREEYEAIVAAFAQERRARDGDEAV